MNHAASLPLIGPVQTHNSAVVVLTVTVQIVHFIRHLSDLDNNVPLRDQQASNLVPQRRRAADFEVFSIENGL